MSLPNLVPFCFSFPINSLNFCAFIAVTFPLFCITFLINFDSVFLKIFDTSTDFVEKSSLFNHLFNNSFLMFTRFSCLSFSNSIMLVSISNC